MPEEPSPTDPVAEQMPLLAGFASASIQELLASGGYPVRRLRSAAAVVFQDASLLPWRTVIGNVLYGLECQGVNAREARKRAGHFIEMVGLQGFEHHYPYELSGGMRLTGKMR
jgi:NitT/TauT family transport system ATP-binding protein